ncbi:MULTISPECIES: GGDEF domain-containing protein [unclassified Pseudonocardia]|uniref:GGDEF domain-containing protein n=1 Tax=unclassified Pseudonocardia TaxID=2619320 RepID=UPI0001FFEA31|nr:GGDEF domain-containing protein [Pseudonocardia sp. Ae707_Ps1]OLM19270.1 diguanylate cyclase/phosphodiesterase (GGDEF & EAL domains) with PAS/PAC sensor(s) [Pseudonocardia sp. Ae707_Ps1]
MTSHQAVPRARRRWWPSGRWTLLELPAGAVVFVLAAEAVAVGTVVAGVLAAPVPDGADLLLAALLTVVAGAHTELSRNAERLRRRIAETRFVNMTSVWTFSAALLLPAPVATAVVLAVYTHLFLRVSHPAGTPVHRHLFSTTTVVLAVHAVAVVSLLVPAGPATGVREAVVVLVALPVYACVNTLLVVSVLRLTRPGSRFLPLLLGGEILLELATLSLGGLVAVIIAHTSPWLVLLAVLPLAVLEQTTLVRQLETQVDTDAKTGLLNPAAWRWRGRRLLERCRRTDRAAAVLILDLDHFKGVNDRYGHLAGDDVLQAVAGVLTAEIRDHDLAGRFGGEEFVVALGGLRPDDVVFGRAREVAERIRRSVAALDVPTSTAGRISGLSVSVGVAASPDHGDDLDTLLAAADAALYEAKRAGRNQVRVRHSEPAPQGEPAAPPFGLSFGT